MDKTFLEKRIQEKAEARFKREYTEFLQMLNKSTIASVLKIDVGKAINLSGPVETTISLNNFGINRAILNGEITNNETSKFCNLKEVKKILIERYVKEETDELLDKLKTFEEYLFNN